jgi:hypothetical protein
VFFGALWLSGCGEGDEGSSGSGAPIFRGHQSLLSVATPLPEGYRYIGDTGVGAEVYHAQLSYDLPGGEGSDYLDVSLELTTDAVGAEQYFDGLLRSLRAQHGNTFVPVEGLGEDSAHSAYRKCLVLFLRNNAVVQVRSETAHSSALELARALDALFEGQMQGAGTGSLPR